MQNNKTKTNNHLSQQLTCICTLSAQNSSMSLPAHSQDNPYLQRLLETKLVSVRYR